VLLAAAACCGLRPSEAAWRARAAPRAGFEAEGPDSAAAMEHAYKFVLRYGSILAVVLIIVWPLLALAAGTFTRPYFYFWVILSIVWGLARAPLAAVATACCPRVPEPGQPVAIPRYNPPSHAPRVGRRLPPCRPRRAPAL